MVSEQEKVGFITGLVVRDSRDKTIKVQVQATKRHDLYGKVVRRSTYYHVHDESNVAKVGNIVRIRQTRPYSKTKSWELVEVVS